MYTSSALFLILAAAIALCSVDAWTTTSSASSFGGRSLATSTSSQVVVVQNGSSMEMKKGKANVPPQMRGQYERQREMSQMQQQMKDASQPGADGFPVFNLFVRTKSQKVCLFLTILSDPAIKIVTYDRDRSAFSHGCHHVFNALLEHEKSTRFPRNIVMITDFSNIMIFSW